MYGFLEQNINDDQYMSDMNLDKIKWMSDDEIFKLLDNIEYEEKNKSEKKTENKEQMCEQCNTREYIVEDIAEGIIICTNCGNVLSEIFDTSPEWKNYSESGKDLSRCNGSTNYFLPQSSLGTTIACYSKCKIKMLQTWGAMPYRERSLNIVLKEIQNKCRSASIMKCIEDEAKILYKNIMTESKIMRCSNRKSLIAACVFYACKRKNKTRSPKEIAKLFDIKYKDMTKGCKIFLRLIKLKQMNYEVNVSNAEDFISRYCRELHISNDLIDQTIKIVRNIKKLNIASSHAPYSIAVGSILLIIQLNNINIEKKILSEKFDISEPTINKTYKIVKKYKDIIFDDELTDQIVILLEEERKNITIPDSLKDIYENMNCKEVVDNIIIEDAIDISELEKLLKPTNINNKKLDEYFTDIDLELYEYLSETESIYNEIMLRNNSLMKI